MTSVSIPASRVHPLVSDIGQLLGLLTEDGANLDVDFDWFADVPSELRDVPSRRAAIVKLLRYLLGKTAPDTPTDRAWYPLPLDGAPTPVYVVLPKDDSGTTSPIGVGICQSWSKGQLTLLATAYVPLFSAPVELPIVITGSAENPIELSLTISFGQTVQASGVSFDGIELACEIFCDEATPATLSLTFTNMEPAGPQSTVHTLDSLRTSTVTDWIDAVLGVPAVGEWLDRKIGSSSVTIGAALANAGLLAKKGDTELLATGDDAYTFGTLDSLVGKSPTEIAEWLLASVLKTLAGNTKPLVSLGKGGIWVFSLPAGEATLYGLRLQVPDIDLSPTGGPSIVVQLGKLLSGDTKGSTWISRSDPKLKLPDAGVSIALLSESGDTPPVPSFAPRLDLVSLGVDVAGVNDTPLLDVNGLTLGGIEPRFTFSCDLAAPKQVTWGVGLQVDDLGIPLGNGLTGASSNPIAQNLLSSGGAKDDAGSDNSAVNPTFSAAVSRVFDPVNAASFNVQLEQDGAPASLIWIPMQRAFGPLQCRRIGVEWPAGGAGKVLTFLFDGGVALGPLAIDLQDLSLGIPLATPGQIGTYELDLQGLGVAYESPELSVSGGFLKNTAVTPVEYDGAAMIRAATWSIEAIGSYASLDRQPSLFIFAQLGAELGGPPFFFVTGLCAGFGYNRSLRIPTVDEVADFPLLAGIDDPSKIGGKDATPEKALTALADWVAPAQGVNWVAAGVQFTSFELVHSNVIVTAVISSDFQLAILGLARMKLAQTGPQFAYAELGLAAVLHPSAGFLGISAQLTPNSYILTQDCHLTGGFAFWMWYDGAHAGDFVITLGGYHPAFQKPTWYPDVPRLGFSWHVSDNLTIQGDAYFALTPSCAMGGGALDVEFHSGDLRAWFNAHADFLFTWKPFYFIGDVGVSIGASYKLDLLFTSVTVSVELGADLEIWGPPTGGVVHVSWYIISFSVGFGASKQPPAGFLGWDDFTSLLPQKSASSVEMTRAGRLGAAAPPPVVVNLAISNGLVSTDDAGAWLVRGDALTFSVTTAFPLTSLALAAASGAAASTFAPAAPGNAIAVRPMGVSGVTSVMTITLAGPKGTVNMGTASGWKWAPTLKEVPVSLWGPPLPEHSTPAAPSADTIPGALVGVGGIAPPTNDPKGPDAIPLDRLSHDTIDLGQHWLPLTAGEGAIPLSPQPSPTSLHTIADTIATSATGMRANVFAALASLGYDAGTDGDMDALAANVNRGYPDAPMLGAPWQEAA